jgi:hypothetical protein
VRTIQRIETGEVTPRSYTIKTILSALDYDFEKITVDDADIVSQDNRSFTSWFRNLMLIDSDTIHTPGFQIKQLNLAWIFGIIYFIISFPEGAAEYARFKGDEMLVGVPVYIGMKVLLLIAFLFFQRGFMLIGTLFDNYLLKVMSVVLIGAKVLLTGFDIVSIIFTDYVDQEIILFGFALLYGAIGIVYGISIRRLDRSFGRVAELAGIIEILAACLFLTVILAFIGDLVLIPAELLEIILIFKSIELIKAKTVVGTNTIGAQ